MGVGYQLIGLYTLLKHGERPGFLFYLWCLASAVFYLLSPVPPPDLAYRLIFTGDGHKGEALPLSDWGVEFADDMPDEIRAAISAARGDSAGAGVSGLTITAADVTVHGLVINRFDGSGVVISGSAATRGTSRCPGTRRSNSTSVTRSSRRL